MLTQRQKSLLRLIVREYIDTATPAGSQAMVQKYRLPLSPATVRNDMVELEESGYIVRAHSSAGAVPSDEGYRYYVETLLEEAELTLEEQRTIRHQFHQVELELEQWSRLAAAVMAQMARNVALVTLPRVQECRWRRLEIIPLQESMALLVLVLQEAHVRQQIFHLAEPVAQEELNALATRLNGLFAGLSRREIQRREVLLDAWEGQIMEEVLEIMAAAYAVALERPYVFGLSMMLSQPEFVSTEQVRGIVAALEEGRFLQPLLQEPPRHRGVRVVIGQENLEDAMRQCSLILSDYGAGGNAVGTLGILGPRRMDYRRAIPTVRYLATLLTELSTDLMGQS